MLPYCSVLAGNPAQQSGLQVNQLRCSVNPVSLPAKSQSRGNNYTGQAASAHAALHIVPQSLQQL